MPFVAGQSGNPGGRSRVDPEVKALARQMAPEAMQKLIELMQTGEPKIAIQAANAVLDRAYGKPAQAIAGPDGDGPAELLISWAQSQS